MPPKRYFDQEEGSAAVASSQEAPVVPATTSNKGKEKEPRANATLFISRLPFSATSTDVTTLFSDVGPLRRAFVVTDPATKASKGVGYVTFAVPEDAQRALDELQGKKLDGKRAILISWADAKPTKKEAAEQAASGLPPAKRPRVSVPQSAAGGSTSAPSSSSNTPYAPKDADAVRTVILSGLAACKPLADAKTLYKRARKIGDVQDVRYPLPAEEQNGVQSQDVAHVIFRTPNHAATAVSKLHAHVFKGAQLSAVLKKRADGAARLAARMRPETKEKFDKLREQIEQTTQSETLPPREALPVTGISTESRLIIRNLPFDVTPADLRAVFLPFGPIFKIDVPQKAASNNASEKSNKKNKRKGDGEEADKADATADAEAEAAEDVAEVKKEDVSAPIATKGRGFAFVWHVSRSDAMRALEGVNGRAIRHGEAEKAAAKAAKGPKGRQQAREKLKEARDNAQPERIVAVDWALSKDEWKKKEEETEVQQPAQEEGKDSESGDDEDNDDDESGSELGSEASGDGEDDETDASDDEEGQKPSLPAPSEGTTLFVRNLPYEATEPELLTLFKQFGPVRYARITMDRSTTPPRSKGTGFVCFWDKTHAHEALQKAREVEQEAGSARGQSSSASAAAATAQNPFSMTTSVLTADPSAPLTASFNIRGRILNVIPAVERKEADSLSVAGQKARQKQDKRNTYLMREGVPLPNTPLAEQLSGNENEIERRLASFSQRRSQLSVNPSLYISKTRLSIRQLPLFATDRMLKRLAIHAIKTFKSEAKEGKRQDLDEDELHDRTFSLASKPPKKGERSTSVVQSKVVRAMDRPDFLTPGLGRSKGFGFLEIRSFHEALRVLRWANANADIRNLMVRWHIEEMEDLLEKLKSESETKEETQSRIKRIEKHLVEVRANGARAFTDKSERGGLLFVEFAIENATIVKQRQDRADQNRRNAEKRLERSQKPLDNLSQSDDNDDEEQEEEEEEADLGGRKPPRRATWNQSTKTKERKMKEKSSDKVVAEQKGDKLGNKLGSMIGRKRKNRKGKA
ncbi:unnamed protein product [Sympodiomycopsis kandeliae]